MAANVDAPEIRRYLSAAPHLRHAGLHALFRRLAADATTLASVDGRRPHVLDLGAGEGSATIAFLEAGAHVTAVDEDGARLDVLRRRAVAHAAGLESREGDALELLDAGPAYDVVAAVSFLHHVPDYTPLVEAALDALRPGGVFFSFQDPFAARLARPVDAPSTRAPRISTWRLGQGDVRARCAALPPRGASAATPRRSRRTPRSSTRCAGASITAGCSRLFAARGVPVRLVLYFSTQSAPFQRVGSALGLQNTFALIGGPVG